MSRDDNALRQRLSALLEEFEQASKRVRQASYEMTESGLPPSERLLDDLATARARFLTFQAEVRDLATSLLGVETVSRDRIDTLAGLRELLALVSDELARRERAEEERVRAVAVLDRVLALVHRDDPGSEALAKCLARARELRGVMTALVPPATHPDAEVLAEGTHPFAQLLALVDQRTALTDERAAPLMRSVTYAFGPGLAAAALLGKLRVCTEPAVADDAVVVPLDRERDRAKRDAAPAPPVAATVGASAREPAIPDPRPNGARAETWGVASASGDGELVQPGGEGAGVEALGVAGAAGGAAIAPRTILAVPRRDTPRALTATQGALLYAIVYLAAIAFAEFVTAFVDPRWGAVAHIAILSGLLVEATYRRLPQQRDFFLSLALAPLIRLVSLALPLGSVQPQWRYALVSVPLFAAAFVLIRTVPLTRRQVGVQPPPRGRWPVVALVAASGGALGYGQYLLLRPAPLLGSPTPGAVALAAAILLLSTGLLEELLFRGILQATATEALGTWPGLVYVSVLYGVLASGQRLASGVVFAIGVALYFAIVVRWTRSLIGVALAHGAMNVLLLIILPLWQR